MKAIIHIGMAKTGSTSIQEWLRSNFTRLEAESIRSNQDGGTLEKNSRHDQWGAIYHTAKHEMGVDESTLWIANLTSRQSAKRLHDGYERLTNLLEKFSGKSGIFVHSAENLFRCEETQALALDKYFSSFFDEVNYVCYIRNTVDLFDSWYSQKIHNGFTEGYNLFLKNCASDLVPYGPKLTFRGLFNWYNALGDRLNVRLLESDWLVNGDLIEDFASLAGVPAFEKPGRLNKSFAAEYIEYVRYLNGEFRDALPQEIFWIALDILKSASSGKPKLAASEAQAKSILDLHNVQEEEVRERFFPDRPILFAPKVRGKGIGPAPLTEFRKAKIESEIREKIAPRVWAPHELAR